MGKKKDKDLPCIAINYEPLDGGDSDTGVCGNPAKFGVMVDKEKRICYCPFHWKKLMSNGSVNVNYDEVVEKKKKKSPNIKDEYKDVKEITKCGKREISNAPECAYKIICEDDKGKGCKYFSAASSPRTRTPVAGGSSPTAAAGRAASLGSSPKSAGSSLTTATAAAMRNAAANLQPPPPPGAGSPRSASSGGISPTSSKKSKKSKKDDSDSESDSGSGSDSDSEAESGSDSEAESGSDVSDSDSDSDSDAEVKTKLHVVGYGGKDKKIKDYGTIKKAKNLKPSKRNIRGRYEVVRSDTPPYFVIDRAMVDALEVIDTTYDLNLALEKIGYIQTTIKNEPKNINLSKKKTNEDESMYSVEESVVNYVAEKFAPYMNDTDRIELLMCYLFDFDRRDLTKDFEFYGFTKPSDMAKQTPYQRLKIYKEGKKFITDKAFPEPYHPDELTRAREIQTTSTGTAKATEKKDNSSGGKNECQKKLGQKSFAEMIEALQKAECVRMDVEIASGSGKSTDLKGIYRKIDGIIQTIFKSASKPKLDKYKLKYNEKGNRPDFSSKSEALGEEASGFIEVLYKTFDDFVEACVKAGVSDTNKIKNENLDSFVNSLAGGAKGNEGLIGPLNDNLLKELFGDDYTPPQNQSNNATATQPAAGNDRIKLESSGISQEIIDALKFPGKGVKAIDDLKQIQIDNIKTIQGDSTKKAELLKAIGDVKNGSDKGALYNYIDNLLQPAQGGSNNGSGSRKKKRGSRTP